jgi:peptide/nickel transport system permease protein
MLLRFIVRRLLAVVPVMAVVAFVVFLLLYLTPGDPAVVMAGDNATPEMIAQIRQQLHLDDPLLARFLVWLTHILRGDLGVSIFSNLPVTTLLAQRAEPTLSLAVVTIVLATVVAVPLGAAAAYFAGRWIDRLIMVVCAIGLSVPLFVLAYALIYYLSLRLSLFPVQGFTSVLVDPVTFLRKITLPAISLGVGYVVLIARITRASVLEVLNEDYVRTARARGVSEFRVVMHHVLRNAAVPIITVIGIGTASLIGGVVVAESIFNIPGVGRLVIDAILKRDYPVIQGVILVLSAIYVLVNLVIDLAYAVFDPRVRY